jgi:hypothetical protein
MELSANLAHRNDAGLSCMGPFSDPVGTADETEIGIHCRLPKEMMMAEMAYSLEGRLLVAVNTNNPIPADEWTACVRATAAHANAHWGAIAPCILVVTDGGAPTTVQRKAARAKRELGEARVKSLSGAI